MKEVFFIGNWRVEPQTNSISNNEKEFRLEPRLMSLLITLAENAAEVVSKEDLLDKVWKDVFVTEQVLKVSISELRKSLNDDARKPIYIKTIPKKGYQLIAPISFKEKPDKQNQTINSSKSGKTKKSKKLIFSFVSLGVLVLLATISFWYLLDKNEHKIASNSIAVLPLRDISENKSEEFFSEGLTETLTTHLAKSKNLKVISPRSALNYKDSKKTIAEIAKELKVESLLEGTILRNGDNVSLNLRLINASSEKIVWAETYQKSLTDIFDLQSEIFSDISKQFIVEINSPKVIKAKVNAEAYEAYLKGRYLWNKRNPDDIKQSLIYFQKAIELEPNTSLFHTGIADAFTVLAFYAPDSKENYHQKAKDNAKKALELNKNSAEAHSSLGAILHKYDVDWENAEKQFQTAVEINPNYPTAHQWYGIYLASTNRCVESLNHIDKAIELDPLSMVMRTDKGWLLYMCDKNDEALDNLEDVHKLNPNFGATYFLILAYTQNGLFDKAIKLAEESIPNKGNDSAYVLLSAYSKALAGRKTEAENQLKSFSSKYDYFYEKGLVNLALGKDEKAIDYLEKVVERKSSWQPFLKSQPELKKLHSNKRFQNLMKKLNLD